jgi:hypothetical protein
VGEIGPGRGLAAVDVQVEPAGSGAGERVPDLLGDLRGRDEAHRQGVRGRRVERAQDHDHEDCGEQSVRHDEAAVRPEPGPLPARSLMPEPRPSAFCR